MTEFVIRNMERRKHEECWSFKSSIDYMKLSRKLSNRADSLRWDPFLIGVVKDPKVRLG